MAGALWVVHTKGLPEKASFEIAVIRMDNDHGRASYGWFGENKHLISSSGGPCRDYLTPLAWDLLVAAANVYADEMNKRELSA